MNRVSAFRITTLIILVMFIPLEVSAKEYTVTWSLDPDCSLGVCDFQSALTEASSNGEDDTINLPSTREYRKH